MERLVFRYFAVPLSNGESFQSSTDEQYECGGSSKDRSSVMMVGCQPSKLRLLEGLPSLSKSAPPIIRHGIISIIIDLVGSEYPKGHWKYLQELP